MYRDDTIIPQHKIYFQHLKTKGKTYRNFRTVLQPASAIVTILYIIDIQNQHSSKS